APFPPLVGEGPRQVTREACVGAGAGAVVTRCAVGVMARAPSSAGKTRLAPDLSESRLHALRIALLADTLRAVSSVPDIDVTIFYTPEGAASEIRAICGRPLPLVPQISGDLGSRMQAAMAHLLDAYGCEAALLVGSDVPLITAECLLEARAI